MAVPTDCEWWDVVCKGGNAIGDVVSQASNDAIQELTNRVMEGFGKAIASMGSMWVAVPTPILTAGDGSTTGGGTRSSVCWTAVTFSSPRSSLRLLHLLCPCLLRQHQQTHAHILRWHCIWVVLLTLT